jgi:MFS transporter, Spinster family, sphingosine-1-phosphate transporter
VTFNYKNRLLLILGVILAFNYVDRSILGLVLQNIKTDLSLSDTQLGFLTGIAFAVFYSVMGLPIARWADRGNRVTIISVTTALWSVAVVLSGLASNFVQLLLSRVVAGVGEAGCTPPAYSMIADGFTRAERPRAVARYQLGAPLSNVISLLVGGWLNELYGWRMTFMLLGLPGLVLAVVARCCLKEPRNIKPMRGAASPVDLQSSSMPEAEELASVHPSLKEVFATLWSNRTYRHLLICNSLVYFFAAGINAWQATFFIRSFGLKTGELGIWFTLVFGLGGVLGLYWGGEWAARYARDNERLQLKAMAVMYCCFSVISTLTYLSPDKYIAFTLLGVGALSIGTAGGPLFAMIQALVPERMQAVSIAIIFLVGNLVGSGLGPLAVGALSDALRSRLGEESLRYALLAMYPGFLWAAWHFWRASRTVTHDLQADQTHQSSAFQERHVALNASLESFGPASITEL